MITDRCHRKLIQIIKAERKRARIQQTALAKRLKLTQNSISRLEHGERRVEFCEFLMLASVIGFDPVPVVRALARLVKT